MDKLKLTSPGLLLILAMIATGGIVLLDAFYLGPRSRAQHVAAINEQAFRAEQACRLVLGAEEHTLARSCAAWAKSGRNGYGVTNASDSRKPDSFMSDMLIDTEANLAWLEDESGTVRFAWACQDGGEPSQCSPKDAQALAAVAKPASDSKQGNLSGLIPLPGGLAIFAFHDLSEPNSNHSAGGLWLARYLDQPLMDRVGSAAGCQLSFVASDKLPASEIASNSPTRSLWLTDNGQLVAGWMANSVDGGAAGYLRATMPMGPFAGQASAGRRTVLIVLSLSVGLSILVILGAHMLITGPVVRLLIRLQRLECGQGSAKDLVRNLHGEPLMLARQLESAFDRLAVMSKTDQLTGLANRGHFEQILSAFYNQARRYNRPLSLLMLDLDFFKAVNDTGGHQAGDELLKRVSRAIESACRKADLPARLGGDEFAVLMPETACVDAWGVADRILQTISSLDIRIRSSGMKITISAGLADLNSGEMDSPEAMMALADRAMYAAKEMGRNRIIQAHDLNGLDYNQNSETSSKVNIMCKKLAGLDSQFKELFLKAIEELVAILEQRNPHMARHAHKVQHFAVLIGKEMELSNRVLKRLEIAAMLHDIGMIAMPDALLLNPGELSENQLATIRRHPLLSARIMESMEFLEQEIPAVRYHHERFDGKGYPEGIAGASIPLTARILSVADAFDALTSDRAFRQAKSLPEALKDMRSGAGTQFDPSVVEAFMSVAGRLGQELMVIPEATRTVRSARKVMAEITDSAT